MDFVIKIFQIEITFVIVFSLEYLPFFLLYKKKTIIEQEPVTHNHGMEIFFLSEIIIFVFCRAEKTNFFIRFFQSSRKKKDFMRSVFSFYTIIVEVELLFLFLKLTFRNYDPREQ